MRTPTPGYACREDGRVDEVAERATLNGIAYLEVASEDQRTLRVTFVHPLPGGGAAGAVPAGGATLGVANVRILGGVRVRGVRVLDVQSAGNVLTVVTDASGDFSTYTLRLVASGTPLDARDEAAVPPGYDPRLALIDFSFKAGCRSEFDCARDDACPPGRFDEPAISYRAKDYASFRRLMLDRLSALMPAWGDWRAADPLVTLVEALALTADHLSYRQDAIATEAYLGTARRRVSLRRHARLLDYRMHDGCNARTWVHVSMARGAADATLPARTPILTRGASAPVVLDERGYDEAVRAGATVFETMHAVELREDHNAIALHRWSGTGCCLPKGATRATLVNDPPLALRAGDWLLFEEVFGPITGRSGDADPEHRQVVRLTRVGPGTDPLLVVPVLDVEWDAADALRFPLCLDEVPGEAPGTVASVARGNLVLADHGRLLAPAVLRLEPAPADRPPRARLREPGLTFAVPFSAARFADEAATSVSEETRRRRGFLTAAAALETSPADAMPVLELSSGLDAWESRRDLLSSDRFATHVVVEIDESARGTLRFGDGVHGARPGDDTTFAVAYRVGGGRAGNVGAESLARVATDLRGIAGVRNPLPAAGGMDAESMESVRQFAPQAFRTQERAVTAGDWAELAQRDASIQRASAQYRWTGSWHTAFVAVDRRGGLDVEQDAVFLRRLAGRLDRYRLAGYDVEIEGPTYVPLDVALHVCVRSGYFASDVKEELQQRFSSVDLPGGGRGFFHPDEFTFGQPVYLSRMLALAMRVPGVESARVERFHRFGKLPAGERASGVIAMSAFEVARCDSDPSRPEQGRVEVIAEGGL